MTLSNHPKRYDSPDPWNEPLSQTRPKDTLHEHRSLEADQNRVHSTELLAGTRGSPDVFIGSHISAQENSTPVLLQEEIKVNAKTSTKLWDRICYALALLWISSPQSIQSSS